MQELSSRLMETKCILAILTKLLMLDENLQMVNSHLASQDYVKATESLHLVKCVMCEPVTELEGEIKILSQLSNQYKAQNERVPSDVKTAWAKAIHWSFPKSDEDEIKFTELCVENTSQNPDALQNICQAMVELDIFDETLTLFCTRLFKYMIKPIIIEKNVDVTTESTSEKSDCKKLRVQCSKEKNENPVTPEKVFQRLVTLFYFLHDQFNFEVLIFDRERSEKIPVMIMSELGSIISANVIEEIIGECLTHSIPSNSQGLQEFNQVISHTAEFQKELVNLQFIADDDKALTDFVGNVNVLFANKRCVEILQRARVLMMSHMHNITSVTEDHPFGELPGLDLGVSKAKKSKAAELSLSSEAQLYSKVLKLPKCSIR